jgi:trimeric autotransporter adhesin
MKKTKNTFKQLMVACLLGAGLLLTTTTYAQAPKKFNYQGIARDEKGTPIGKQNMSLKIAVLPTADATVAEYEETQNVTTNEFGLYTLQIGSGTPIAGDMKLVKWETGNKYIKVSIDPKGGTDYKDMGTNQLLSVPYAIYADKAGTAGVPVDPSGKATRAAVTNTTTPQNFGWITKWSGSSPSVIDNSALWQSTLSNYIGFGTTNPLTRFHIKEAAGTGRMELRLQKENGEPRVLLLGDNTNTIGMGPTSNYSLLWKRRDRSASPGTAMPIVPSPLYSPGFPEDRLCLFANSQGSMLFNTSNDFGVGYFDQPLNSTKTNLFIQGTTAKTGINTVTPNAQLDVNGTGQATGIHAIANQQSVAQTQSAITGAMGATSPYVESIAIFGEAKASGFFPNGNNVGVAGSAVIATSPQNNVGIMGEAGNASGYNTAVAGTIVQGTNPYFENAAIRGYAPNPITNVFPNTKSYAGLFDGRVAIRDGSQFNNYVFTSDAAGTGTWKDPCTLPCIATIAASAAAAGNDWKLIGNAATIPGTAAGQNFIGTTDNQDVVFGRNATTAGRISSVNTSFGNGSNVNNNGTDNSSFGVNTLNAITTGYRNTAIGFRALEVNTTGVQNTAVGDRSLLITTTGSNNTSIGHQAMERNTTGSNNTGVGVNASFGNTTGEYNVATGYDAMVGNATGWFNVANGASAMYNNVSGFNNVAVGRLAMVTNVGGSNNTTLGNMADVDSFSNNATAIGSNAYAPQNNTVILGSINGVNGATADAWTGIGTNTPNSTFDIKGSYAHSWKGPTAGIVNMDDKAHVGYITAGQTATYNLPNPFPLEGREYILVNQTDSPQNVASVPYGGSYTGFWNFFSVNQTTVPAHSSITIMSFGTGGWVQIR